VLATLFTLRILHWILLDSPPSRATSRPSIWRTLAEILFTLGSIDGIFWPATVMSTLIAVGPWHVAKVGDHALALVFSWGVFVFSGPAAPMLTPPNMTFLYGSFALLTLWLPALALCATAAFRRMRKEANAREENGEEERLVHVESGFHRGDFIQHCVFICILCLQFLQVMHEKRNYGWVAVFGPYAIGWMVVTASMYRNALNVAKDSQYTAFRSIWG